jgi:hypothetical protein
VSLQLVIDRAVTLARCGDLELLTNPSSDLLGARMANEEVSNQLGCIDTSVGTPGRLIPLSLKPFPGRITA